MLTATRICQICDVKPNQRFRFVRLQDGDPATEYVKIGNTHYRKASAEHGCCLPVVALAAGIRTRVEPS
jgi:hypothetical protein